MRRKIQYLKKQTVKEFFYKCLGKDEEAWNELNIFIYKIIKYHFSGLSQEEIEDCQGLVILTLIERGIEQVREPSKFLSFVKTLTIYKTVDYLRSKKWEDSINHETENIHNQTAESLVICKQSVQIILQELKRLSRKCRIIIQNYFEYKAGKTKYMRLEDLARSLDLSGGTFGSNVNRCLKSLTVRVGKIKDRSGIAFPESTGRVALQMIIMELKSEGEV